MAAGQVIIVAGTSGAGKTTTIETFPKRQNDSYLMFGIDNLLGTMMPADYSLFGKKTKKGMYSYPEDPDDAGSRLAAGFGEIGWRGIHAFHEMIAAASRAGQNLIADHLAFVDPPILQDCVKRLEGLPVLLVNLKPPYEVLMERLATRQVHLPDTFEEVARTPEENARLVIANTMQKLTPWFYDASYKNDIWDIEIDTIQHSPEEVSRLIEERLAEGPGTAFEQLRERYQDA